MTVKTTNNHDLPNQATTTIDLNLPEQLTIDDLFPALDFGFPMTQPPSTQHEDRAIADSEEWTSTLEPQTQTQELGFGAAESGIIHDDDLGLDLGEDVGMDTTVSMQVGRGEATPMIQDDTVIQAYDDDGDDLGLDLGEDVGMAGTIAQSKGAQIAGDHASAPMGDVDDETAPLRENSPLSEADLELMGDGDRTFQQDQTEIEEEQAVAQQRPTNRRLKPMLPDRDTVIHNSEIKALNADRSKILKPQSLLPQDPELIALMEMQRNGDFVTNAMNDGYGSAWAPEIQGLLSFDLVYRAGQKRKRDSGIADVASEDGHSDKSPRLDRSGHADEDAMIDDEGVEVRGSSPRAETHKPIPGETDEPALADVVPGEDEEGIYADAGEGGFDDTTMPLVHPADSGPISVGTQHAVHLLREVFGGSSTAESPASQSKKSVLLQELIPEEKTTKADATKMFFETLVLATKDAIKVEQQSSQVGLPIRVRAKRGLWGAWAEPSTQLETSAQEVAA